MSSSSSSDSLRQKSDSESVQPIAAPPPSTSASDPDAEIHESISIATVYNMAGFRQRTWPQLFGADVDQAMAKIKTDWPGPKVLKLLCDAECTDDLRFSRV